MKRRAFLQVSGAAFAGLILEALPGGFIRLVEAAEAPFAPNPWLRIAPDGQRRIQTLQASQIFGMP